MGLGEMGAPLATGCSRDCGSAWHCNTLGHPSHDPCRTEPIPGCQARGRTKIPALYAGRSNNGGNGYRCVQGPMGRIHGERPRVLLRKQWPGPPPLAVAQGPCGSSSATGTRLRAPAATRSRQIPWMPGCSHAMAQCSRRRPPVLQRARRNVRNCNHGCADAGHGSLRGARHGTGWTRASVRPSVGQSGGL